MRLRGIRRVQTRVVHRVGFGDDGRPQVTATLARGFDQATAGSAGRWSVGRDDDTVVEVELSPSGQVLAVIAHVRSAVVDGPGLGVTARLAGVPVFDRADWGDPQRRHEPTLVTAVRLATSELELRVGPERAEGIRACWVGGNLQMLVDPAGEIRAVRFGPLSRAEWATLGAVCAPDAV